MHDLLPGSAILDDVKKMDLLRYSRQSPERLDFAVTEAGTLLEVPRAPECFKESVLDILADPNSRVFDEGPMVVPGVGCATSYYVIIPPQGSVQPVKDGE
jgi:hypothetical protein